ncbi:MAG: hypothetical protein IH916_02380, partial [Acidobacteria bacterium]|nr:hypothetical protein [Acidobacteriota bacterium]
MINRAAGPKNQPEAIFSKWQGDEQMFKSIRIFFIAIAPIALLGLAAEVHAQAATDVDCNGCVDISDIAAQAVGAAKLKDGAVTRDKLRNNSVNTGKIQGGAVTTKKIRAGAVTTAKIRDGAVTAAKAAPELSNAIDTFCMPDETVIGMDASGNFTCQLPQTLASDGSFNTRAGRGALIVNTSFNNTAFG